RALRPVRLRAALLLVVADEAQNFGDPAAFAHRCEQDLAGAIGAVGPLKRHLETPQLAIECRGEILSRDARSGSIEPSQRRAPAAALPHIARGRVDEGAT